MTYKFSRETTACKIALKKCGQVGPGKQQSTRKYGPCRHRTDGFSEGIEACGRKNKLADYGQKRQEIDRKGETGAATKSIDQA